METLLLTVPPAEATIQYYLLLLEIKTSLRESRLQVSQQFGFFWWFFFFKQLRWRSQRKYVALASPLTLSTQGINPDKT